MKAIRRTLIVVFFVWEIVFIWLWISNERVKAAYPQSLHLEFGGGLLFTAIAVYGLPVISLLTMCFRPWIGVIGFVTFGALMIWG